MMYMSVVYFQMRNNKKTAILVKEVNTKKRLFLVYRPNTGRQVKLETYTDLKKKFKKVRWHSFIYIMTRRRQNILCGESYVFCSPCIRSCQKMPSSTGLTSTSLQKKSAHTHIGMCTSDLHGAYFAYCILIPHLLMLLLRAPNAD